MQCGRPRFNPWVRKIPWRREWQPTPIFLPGESHGQRSLVGCSPWGHKESDTTEWLSLSHTLTWWNFLCFLSTQWFLFKITCNLLLARVNSKLTLAYTKRLNWCQALFREAGKSTSCVPVTTAVESRGLILHSCFSSPHWFLDWWNRPLKELWKPVSIPWPSHFVCEVNHQILSFFWCLGGWGRLWPPRSVSFNIHGLHSLP